MGCAPVASHQVTAVCYPQLLNPKLERPPLGSREA